MPPPITRAVTLALSISIPLFPICASAALPDSVVKISNQIGFEIDTTTDFTGNKHRAGISIATDSSAVFRGDSLIVETLDYGLYLEGSNSQLTIDNTQADVSLTVITDKPSASWGNGSRAFGIYLTNASKLDLTANSLTVSTKHTNMNSAGIYTQSSAASNVTADRIQITAVNEGNSGAYAVYSLSGAGSLNIGTLNTSLVHLEASGTKPNGSSKAYAINAADGTVSVHGKKIDLISNGSTSRTLTTSGSGTVNIGDEESVVTLKGTGSIENQTIYGSGLASDIKVSGREIHIFASGVKSTGVYSVNEGHVSIGGSGSAVTISSKGTEEVVGLRAEQSFIDITADNLVIETDNTSESGYSVGLMALNKSQSSERPENSASINITANDTTITSDGVGISAYSNSRVNLDTGLVLTAPTAVEARGNSLLNINPNGDKTVVINGDVSFGTTATGSGDILDAEVNINLTGAQSKWNGNVKVDYPTNGDIDTTIAKGVTLSLSDQAQWSPNKIAETDADGQTVKSQALNVLKLNDGVVNLGSDLGSVEIKELQGTGGTINTEAIKDDNGNFISSTVQIGEVSNTDGSTPSMTVNYTGITADDLSDVAADMKSLADQTIKVGNETETQDAIDQNFNVKEGNIRGAVTSGYDANGNLLTHQAKNVKLTDYGALNSMTFVQWRNEINHLTKRLGDIRASDSSIGAWARVYGGESQWKSNSEIEMDHTTIQVGADYRVNNHWLVGGAFSYTDSDADLVKGQAKGDSYSLAAYATYLADGGSYLDLIARYGYLDNELTSGNMSVDTTSNAFSLSIETGHTFRIKEQAYIEPQIEVTYGFISGDDTTASNDVRLEQDDFQSLITRVGVRTGFEFPEKAGTIYAMFSYAYDFLGDADGTASQGGLSEALNEDLGGGWVSYGIGAQFKLGDNAFAYGELERTSGGEIDNPYLFNVGFRWNF